MPEQILYLLQTTPAELKDGLLYAIVYENVLRLVAGIKRRFASQPSPGATASEPVHDA